MRKKYVVLVAVFVLLSAPVMAEFTSGNTFVSDDFESYDTTSDLSTNYAVTGTVEISPFANEGSQSIQFNDGGSTDRIDIDSENAISTDRSQPTNFTFDLYIQGSTFENFNLDVYDGTGQHVRADITTGNGNVILDTGGNSGSIGGIQPDTWHTITLSFDYANDEVRVYIDGSDNGAVAWSDGDQWNDDNNLQFFMFYEDNVAGSVDMYVDDLTFSSADVINEELEVEAEEYMKPGSTQTYTVTLNQTTIDGFNETDVTNSANVTSQNTSILTVDESANELIANGTNTGLVNVTFEYSGVEENVSIFVGPQTLANIGLMPSPQWIPSLLGVGEEGTWIGGVGSEFQWLVIVIITVYGLTFVTNSASVGVGVGVGGIIALWVAGYVSVGILLSVLLFGAFITLTTLDLQNDQTVVHEYR